MWRPFPFTATAALAFLIAGCAEQGSFPSLAPRPIEYTLSGRPVPPCIAGEAGGAAAPAEAAPSAPAQDPEIAASIERLLGSARQGQSDFAAILPAAQAAAMRAGAAGSEGWIAAQQEISRLEAARVRTQDALAELEALSLKCSNDRNASAADLQRVTTATEEVRGLATGQQAEIDRLSASLS
jgi:hypothetical protein